MKIFIDFDGTCVIYKYPDIGAEIKGAVDVLRQLVESGNKLILFTMRTDVEEKELTEAVNWFRERNIPLCGIQSSSKAYGDLIIDDTALGIPLIYNPAISDRGFVDWKRVRELLLERGIISPNIKVNKKLGD